MSNNSHVEKSGSGVNHTMYANPPKFGSFNNTLETFDNYIERFDIFCDHHGIADVKKVGALLSEMHPTHYQLLKGLCTPAKPSDKTYKEICELLIDQLCPEQNEISKKSQKEIDEPAFNSLQSVKAQSFQCDSISNLESHQRDQFISGLQDNKVKQTNRRKKQVRIKAGQPPFNRGDRSESSSRKKKKANRGSHSTNDKCAPAEISGNYQLLNNTETDTLILAVVNGCIEKLNSNSIISDQNVINQVLQLRNIINDLNSQVTSQDHQLIKFEENETVICHYCGVRVIPDNLNQHMLQKCSYDVISKQFSKLTVYKLSENGLTCLLCNVKCFTAGNKATHDDSLSHLFKLSKLDPYLSCRPEFVSVYRDIFCSSCQENIPNNVDCCRGHFKSRKHELLLKESLDWWEEGIRYLIFSSNAKCLACNKYVDLESIRSHSLQCLSKDDKKLLGTLRKPNPNKAWCSLCDTCCEVIDLEDHFFWECSKQIHNYYCQNCYSTVMGSYNFRQHLLACSSDDKENHSMLGRNEMLCPEINKLSLEINDSISEVFCFGCGLKCTKNNLSSHIRVQCKTPYKQLIKKRAGVSIYNLGLKDIQCKICVGEHRRDILRFSPISYKFSHDKSDKHKKHLCKVGGDNVHVIYCLLCQENLPDTVDHLKTHINSFRHRLLQAPWKFYPLCKYIAYEGRARCLYCKETVSLRDLKDHHYVLHGDSPAINRVLCSFCGEQINLHKFSDHASNCILSIVNYFCQLCGKAVDGQTNFKNHMKQHH